MSTDRELVELAAKAAGWASWDWLAGDGVLNVYDPTGRHDWFDPLNDSGDALRLVVKLKLHIGMESETVSVWQVDRFGNFQTEVLSHRGDEAATRRAIVRAAAAIGSRS